MMTLSSGGGMFSRFPVAQQFGFPKAYCSPTGNMQKHLPYKVAQEVKHKIVRPTMMHPCYTFDATQVSAAESLQQLAAGVDKRNKRPGRTCKVENCTNSVVQGGLCISHGAKRKQCSHPGCTKNVKKAGLCSTHGPARKKCEHPDCCNIAVQGGLCISHGAKKRLCCRTGCTKKARSTWNHMCKRHYDETLPYDDRRMLMISPTAVHGNKLSKLDSNTQCYHIVPDVIEAYEEATVTTR